MNKQDISIAMAELLRKRGVIKAVACPKYSLRVSDSDGNERMFHVKRQNLEVPFTIRDSRIIIDAFLEIIEDALSRGDYVSISSFGRFVLGYRKGREAKIPGTDKTVHVEGTYYPRFVPGQRLKAVARCYAGNEEIDYYDECEGSGPDVD